MAAEATISNPLESVRHAVDGVVGSDGQGTGNCPTCGGKGKFRFSLSDDGETVVFSCQSGSCGDRKNDKEWIRSTAEALVAAGAPRRALYRLAHQAGPYAASSPDAVGPAPDLPTPEMLAAAEDALYDSQRLLTLLKERVGLSDKDVDRAGIGWDARTGRFWLPVRDGDDNLLTIIRRDFRPVMPAGRVKSLIWKGSKGAFLYAPFGVRPDAPVIIAAGERDCLALCAVGLNAVCFTNGESAVPARERMPSLIGTDVVFLYDNDEGNHSKKVASAILPHVRSARIAHWPSEIPEGADAWDVLSDERFGLPAIEKVLTDARPWGEAEAQAEEAVERAQSLFRERLARRAADQLWDEYEARDDDAVMAEIRGYFNAGRTGSEDLLAEVLTLDEVMALTPQEHLIDGWIATGHYSVFYGAPGAMKTFLANDMAMRISSGLDWHGRDVRKGLVLFFQGEGLTQMQVRIETWKDYYGPEVFGEPEPVYMSEKTFNITTPEGVAAVVRTIRGVEARHGGTVAAAIIDPLLRFAPADGEGVESTAMASVGLDALAKMMPQGAVVVWQHANAQGVRSRGTEHLKMFAGSHIRVERTGSLVMLTQEKYRFGQEMVMLLKPEVEGCGIVFEPVSEVPKAEYESRKAEDKAEKRASAVDKKALELMRWLHVEKQNQGQARNAIVNAGIDGLKSDRAVKALVDDLLHRGDLVEVPVRKYVVSDTALKRLGVDQ